MKLLDIIAGVEALKIVGSTDIEIDQLSQDTRENYSPSTLYFAVPGSVVDGHDYIDDALEKGATAVICEKLPDILDPSVCYLKVTSVREVMGAMVSVFYGNPTDQLKVIAVTGTNGKTTVATNVYQALLALGEQAALFSTAGDFVNNQSFTTHRLAGTSMEIIEFHKNARIVVDSGCKYLCIEATSHALDQNRLGGISVNVAVFTNLTQDHLDYHSTMERYAVAKKKLFDLLTPQGIAIVNMDSSYGALMVSDSLAKIITYGDSDHYNQIHRDLLFTVSGFGINGTELAINDQNLDVLCVGKFNMYNITASYGVLCALGFLESEVARTLSGIKGARGRMEVVTEKNNPHIMGIVDYAHTPDALENVLHTLRELPHDNIITVVGVGGDRDRTKRPQMAHIAQKNSDRVVFTSDNPRTEDPQQIFHDLISGCDMAVDNFEKIPDRDQAIKQAVALAHAGDIILVAGKGHEDYQIIGTEKNHFDDVIVLKKHLKKID